MPKNADEKLILDMVGIVQFKQYKIQTYNEQQAKAAASQNRKSTNDMNQQPVASTSSRPIAFSPAAAGLADKYRGGSVVAASASAIKQSKQQNAAQPPAKPE